MEEKKIKVAMVTNHFGITGIGTVIMNYCRALDKNKYELTIIAGVPVADKYKRECKEYGIHLIILPSRQKNTKNHYIKMWKELKKGRYDIVHDHGSSSMMAIELTLAKLAGVKVRIAHSHNSVCPNMKLHRLLNPYFKKVYTKAVACGKLAGDWLFGENQYEILPNGFCTDDFSFSKPYRDKIRKELGIENEIVIGHIGRVNAQKNQEYLLKVFEQVVMKNDNVILLLVGTGPDSKKVEGLIEQHPNRNQIILYGETDNPAKFYSAMDVFVLPSKFEGLPVVLLEAQISGLPCIVSDKVTREVDFGDISWLSIDSDPVEWANEILKRNYTIVKRESYKYEHMKEIKCYDINYNAKILDKMYTKLMENFF